MYCSIKKPDGQPFECDTRSLLVRAVQDAKQQGIEFSFGSALEFYLFKLDENDNPTTITYDNAGYMDIAPEDKGENIRRQICLHLEQMGITPESSHHEEGPGQNKIDFHYADPLTAADDVMSYKTVVKTVAHSNGLYANFSPKPLKNKPGNAFHINISANSDKHHTMLPSVIAGIMKNIRDISCFLDPCEASYERLGKFKAPRFISWSGENRSQLVRIPAAKGEYRRAEQRSADPTANAYLAYTLLIYAGLDGIKNGLYLPPVADFDLFSADDSVTKDFETLPDNLAQAKRLAAQSSFVKEHLPQRLIDIYCK